jgi:Tol biopolymer transport system component
MKYNYVKFLLAAGIIFFLLSNTYAQSLKQIAFASTNSSNEMLQIFLMDEDGGNKRQMTELDENCYFPKFSPDGKSLVFNTDGTRVYYIENIDDTGKITPVYLYEGFHPTFSPDGSFVIFNSEFEGYLSIYALGIKEIDPISLSSGSYSNQQVMTSDGTKLIYSAFDEEGTKSIFQENLEDTTADALTKISSNKNSNLEPDVTSDGQVIAYASFNTNLEGTIILNKGGKEIALTKGDSWQTPKFSRDDNKIACVKIVDESTIKLYVMNTDGSNKKELSVKGGNVGTYTWIDSENILYDAETGTTSTIGIVNINSGQVQMLTNSGINITPDIQHDYIQPDEVEN